MEETCYTDPEQISGVEETSMTLVPILLMGKVKYKEMSCTIRSPNYISLSQAANFKLLGLEEVYKGSFLLIILQLNRICGPLSNYLRFSLHLHNKVSSMFCLCFF